MTTFDIEHFTNRQVIHVRAWYDAAWERENREMEERRIKTRDAQIAALKQAQAQKYCDRIASDHMSDWRKNLENKLMLEY